jgi:hypothetical protein
MWVLFQIFLWTISVVTTVNCQGGGGGGSGGGIGLGNLIIYPKLSQKLFF